MLDRILLSLALVSVEPLLAQTLQSHTSAELQQLETKLLTTARSNRAGVGLDTLDTLVTSYSQLVVRVHTGEAERHHLWADQIYLSKGTITVVTGGTIIGEHPDVKPGETRGSSIKGGTEHIFHAGDIIYIPANLPHWIKLAPNTTATYLVFKEK